MIERRPSHLGAIAVTALSIFMLATPLAAQDSVKNGDWFCERSAADGRWSCKREGEPALAPSTIPDAEREALAARSQPMEEPPSAEPEPVIAETAEVAPVALEPTRAVEAPSETLSGLGSEVGSEVASQARVEVAAAPAPVRPDPSFATEEEPVATVASVEAVQPDPEPQAAPQSATSYARETAEPAPAADNRPDYQRLAYVPDEPTSLLQLPGEYWVAQLMAVSSKQFLEEYAQANQLRGLSAARVASGDRLFYILILGIYENRALAERAISDLPPPYDTYSPFLRSLKSLQEAMKQADRIAGSSDF